MKFRSEVPQKTTRFALEGDRVVVGANATADIRQRFDLHPLQKSDTKHTVSFFRTRPDGSLEAPIGLAPFLHQILQRHWTLEFERDRDFYYEHSGRPVRCSTRDEAFAERFFDQFASRLAGQIRVNCQGNNAEYVRIIAGYLAHPRILYLCRDKERATDLQSELREMEALNSLQVLIPPCRINRETRCILIGTNQLIGQIKPHSWPVVLVDEPGVLFATDCLNVIDQRTRGSGRFCFVDKHFKSDKTEDEFLLQYCVGRQFFSDVVEPKSNWVQVHCADAPRLKTRRSANTEAKKRELIWTHQLRNIRICETAFAVVAKDSGRLHDIMGGYGSDIPNRDDFKSPSIFPRVGIFVETREHAEIISDLMSTLPPYRSQPVWSAWPIFDGADCLAPRELHGIYTKAHAERNGLILDYLI